MGRIVELQLGRIRRRVEENHRAKFTYDSELVSGIASCCTEADTVGRETSIISPHAELAAGDVGRVPQLHGRRPGDPIGSRHGGKTARSVQVHIMLVLHAPRGNALLDAPRPRRFACSRSGRAFVPIRSGERGRWCGSAALFLFVLFIRESSRFWAYFHGKINSAAVQTAVRSGSEHGQNANRTRSGRGQDWLSSRFVHHVASPACSQLTRAPRQ